MTTAEDILRQTPLIEEGADFLEHFGVKGMKWGKRKPQIGPSKDAKRANQIRNKGDKGSEKALTNKEIEEFARRVNLETKYKKLTPSKRKITTNQVIALATTVNAAIAFSKTDLGKFMSNKIKKQMEWK